MQWLAHVEREYRLIRLPRLLVLTLGLLCLWSNLAPVFFRPGRDQLRIRDPSAFPYRHSWPALTVTHDISFYVLVLSGYSFLVPSKEL